jgi:hypothetical protein
MNKPLDQRLPAEEIGNIISLYRDGQSCNDLAKLYGCSPTGIYHLLLQYDVPIRSQSERIRRFACNHRFFDTIENEAQAYWLGFLAADGNIDNHNSVSLSLQVRDKDQLERFRTSLECEHIVREYSYAAGSFVRLAIRSPEMTVALSKYGIIPNKSFSIAFPTLPSELTIHFIRGYFDGDGGFLIKQSTKQRKAISLDFTGSFPMLSGIAQFFHCSYQVPPRVPQLKTKSGIYSLRYCHRGWIIRIADKMYESAQLFMPRKKQRLYDFLEQHPQFAPRKL